MKIISMLMLIGALLSGAAMAGTVTLKAPAYPWGPGVAHSNVTQAFVEGFDVAGNPYGYCTYYNSRGFPLYAACGWDLAGNPVYANPISRPVFLTGEFGGCPNDVEGRCWLQAEQNDYSVWVRITYPERISLLVTP